MYLNNGLALEHVVQGHEEARFAADPDGFRAELVGAVVELLRNIFLKVDDHPTLSRFFTFEQCVQAMLLLALLDAAVHIFVLLTTQPRQENKNRLSKVLSWFAAPGAVQYLKRTCLGFEIVGPVMALASRKNKPGDVPVLVRLAQGRAHEKAQSQLTFFAEEPSQGPVVGPRRRHLSPYLNVGEREDPLRPVPFEPVQVELDGREVERPARREHHRVFVKV